MKRHTLFIYAALLTLFSAVPPMSAQNNPKQDALYIFRNDGKFNAFYYADIERIAYSDIDTLGIQHDEVVVQEVYALDSIFRIPISAIDSVAFITPSTVYKSDVIRPNKTMTDYIVESDSISWFRLAANTPKNVIPKKGDKILIEDSVAYLPDGFSGIVTKVEESAAGYIITTDGVDLQDLYDRVVMKAAGYCASKKPISARRRIGGELIDEQYKSAEEFEPFELSGSFSPANVSVDLFKAFEDNFSISLEGNFTLSYNFKPIVKEIRSFLYADVSQGVKYNILVKMDREEEFKFTPSGTLGTSLDIPFSALKGIKNWILKKGGKQFYKKMGLLNVNLSFGMFIKGSGTISADMFYHWEGETMFSIGYDKPFLHKPELSDFEVHTASRNKEGTDSLGMNGWGLGLSASVGFFAKAETSVTFLQRRFEAEARVEAGVRIEENIPYITNEIASTPLLKTQKYYDMLNTDETVSRVWFTNFSLGFKRKLIGEIDYSLFSFSPELTFWRTAMGGTVPEIMDIRWIVDKKAPWRGDLTAWYSRDLAFGKSVGYVIYDVSPDLKEPKEISTIWQTADYWAPRVWNKWGKTIETLDTDRKYTAYPVVKLAGYPVIADKKVDFTLGPPNIEPEIKYAEFDNLGLSKDVFVSTNIKDTRFECNATWVKFPWYEQIGNLSISCDLLPEDKDIRQADIISIGYDKQGKEIARDTIKVAQLRPVIGSRYAEFDAKAGEQTVKIYTTVSNVQYSFAKTADNNPDNFCSFKVVNDSTVIVSVKENKGVKRTAVIDIKGTTLSGRPASGFLTVIQEGIGEDPDPGPGPDPGVVDADTLHFDGDGGSVDVVFHAPDGFDPNQERTSSNIVLKDGSDKKNPVYTITVGESWRYRELTVYVQQNSSPSPWDVDVTPIRKEWIIKQTGNSKKKLSADLYSCSWEFGKGSPKAYKVEPVKPYYDVYYTKTDKNFTLNNVGDKVVFKYEEKRDNGQFYESESKVLKYKINNSEKADYKYHLYLEITLAQDEDGYYVESGYFKYHNHGYQENPVGSEKKLDNRGREYTVKHYAECLVEGEAVLDASNANEYDRNAIDSGSGVIPCSRAISFDDYLPDYHFKWNGPFVYKYCTETSNGYIDDSINLHEVHLYLDNMKRVE